MLEFPPLVSIDMILPFNSAISLVRRLMDSTTLAVCTWISSCRSCTEVARFRSSLQRVCAAVTTALRYTSSDGLAARDSRELKNWSIVAFNPLSVENSPSVVSMVLSVVSSWETCP